MFSQGRVHVKSKEKKECAIMPGAGESETAAAAAAADLVSAPLCGIVYAGPSGSVAVVQYSPGPTV
jgi:hypothetical protein